MNGGGTAHIDIDGSGDVYAASGPSVTELSTDGKSAIYSTIPGQADDDASDLAVDSQGAAWIVGQAANGGGFIRKLSPGGPGIVFSNELDLIQGTPSAIAVDANGRAYVGAASVRRSPAAQNALMPNSCPGVLNEFLTALES